MPSHPDHTVERIRRVLAGCEETVNDLVERLTPVIQARVVRALLRHRGEVHDPSSRADVEDLTQSVFLELFKNDGEVLRRWDPEAGMTLENFVGMITERRVIARLRSPGARSTSLEELPADEAASSQPDPEQRLASRELLQCVVERLSQDLSELGRTMFELLFVWDGSNEEVGRKMGMSPETVRRWRNRLRERARRCARRCT